MYLRFIWSKTSGDKNLMYLLIDLWSLWKFSSSVASHVVQLSSCMVVGMLVQIKAVHIDYWHCCYKKKIQAFFWFNFFIVHVGGEVCLTRLFFQLVRNNQHAWWFKQWMFYKSTRSNDCVKVTFPTVFRCWPFCWPAQQECIVLDYLIFLSPPPPVCLGFTAVLHRSNAEKDNTECARPFYL